VLRSYNSNQFFFLSPRRGVSGVFSAALLPCRRQGSVISRPIKKIEILYTQRRDHTMMSSTSLPSLPQFFPQVFFDMEIRSEDKFES